MPDFSLLQAPSFAQSALGGYQAGRQIRQQNDRDAALKGYAANPDDPGALKGLVASAPEIGIPLMERHQKREDQSYIGQLAQRAAGGDMQAANELWRRDPEMAERFAKTHGEALEKGKQAFGNALVEIALAPPEQRSAMWDQRARYLAQNGYPAAEQYVGHYSEENLQGGLADTGMTQKVLDYQRPAYAVRPEGGKLFQTNPYAGEIDPGIGGEDVGASQQPVSAQPMAPKSRSEYEALPPGTQYYDLQGNLKVKGGASPQGSPTFSGN